MGLFSRAPKAANTSAHTATTAPPAPPARQLTLMGVVVRDGTDFDEVFQVGIAALEEASKQFGGINSSIQAAPTGASNRFVIVLENASVLRLFWNRGIGMPPTVMWTFEDASAPSDDEINQFFDTLRNLLQSRIHGVSLKRYMSLDDGDLRPQA